MMRLNNLSSPKGANKRNKRLGRGQGSGRGAQAGKGHKGQKARSGGGVRIGFEGGAMPLYMRLPKRGFKNSLFKKDFVVINLKDLEDKFENGVVNRELLVEKGLLKGANKKALIKVLGDGVFTKKLEFVGIEKFSNKARLSIETLGGKII